MIKMEIENISVGILIPYDNNPRVNDGAVDGVAASIREFGFKVPLIIDQNNVITAGIQGLCVFAENAYGETVLLRRKPTDRLIVYYHGNACLGGPLSN